ncbi:MAG: cation:proton antiporter [Candidatus Sericytochromatia bacterium]|nr:cation:proton antiporter [Candidatus Tanganyikabacteria bacterium]
MTLPLLAAGHADPVGDLALHLAIVLAAARLGGYVARRLGQPPVLGELVVGVLLGNLAFTGLGLFDAIKGDQWLALVAGLGVLVLLFEVGIESTVRQMLQVGASAALVAFLGVAAPFGLGWGLGVLLLPQHGTLFHAFLGATLCATSIGITARVLKDLDLSASKEARVVLGAAVLDDVLGLVVLAVVVGAASAATGASSTAAGASSTAIGAAGGLDMAALGWVLLKAFLFLAGAVVLGLHMSPWLYAFASRLRMEGLLLTLCLAFCFLMAWIAHFIGLAPIVGAFAAGLILVDTEYEEGGRRHTLEEQVRPIATVLGPLFFVLMGMKTDLGALLRPEVLGVALLLTLVAVAGKAVAGLGVLERGVSRLGVGIGMVPRGEVGLVFAGVGAQLVVDGRPLLDGGTFAAIVLMVVLTTLITPPALRWVLARRQADPAAEA